MKKVAVIFIAIIMALSLVACKNDEQAADKTYNIDELYEIAKENMDTRQMNESDAEMLEILMQIKNDEYEELRYMAPETNLNTNQILIIKGKDIDQKIDEYLKNQIELYESYLPEEAEKLKNAEKFNAGDYTVLLVGNSEEEVKKTKEQILK